MRRLGGLVCVLAALVSCSAAPGAPTSGGNTTGARPPDGFPPEEGWPAGELPPGIDRTALDRAVDTAFAGGAAKRVRAVVIIHGGRLVYERYSPNPADGPDVSMPSYSVAKSITSAAVGILVGQHKLTVTDPARVPEWAAPGDLRAKITLDDLLRMSSGLDWHEDTDLAAADGSRDAAHYVAERQLAHPPGGTFNYCTGCTFIVDRAMADAVGGSAAFTTFINTELFGRLGMSVTLSYDDKGTWLGGSKAYATARDYARFGLLYLRDGTWAGQRVLPEGWVEYSRTPSRSNPGYGAGWWLDAGRPGVFLALGYNGQTIGVDRAHDLTYVITATDGGLSPPVSAAILSAFG
ncbi:MAG: serine hydrolase domain-containing protein [Labedaea sp.]